MSEDNNGNRNSIKPLRSHVSNNNKEVVLNKKNRKKLKGGSDTVIKEVKDDKIDIFQKNKENIAVKKEVKKENNPFKK